MCRYILVVESSVSTITALKVTACLKTVGYYLDVVRKVHLEATSFSRQRETWLTLLKSERFVALVTVCHDTYSITHQWTFTQLKSAVFQAVKWWRSRSHWLVVSCTVQRLKVCESYGLMSVPHVETRWTFTLLMKLVTAGCEVG